MNRLEEELRNAMRREEPPEGFLERVLAQAARKKRSAWSCVFAWNGLRWAAAGALCLVLAGAGMEYRKAQQERVRGESAKAQLMLALRIAGHKLQIAQTRVQQLGVPRID